MVYVKFINQYNCILGQETTLGIKRLEEILEEEGIDLKEWATSNTPKKSMYI